MHILIASPKRQGAGVPTSGVAQVSTATGDPPGMGSGVDASARLGEATGSAAGEAIGYAQPAPWTPASSSSVWTSVDCAAVTTTPLTKTNANATIRNNRRMITSGLGSTRLNPHCDRSRAAFIPFA